LSKLVTTPISQGFLGNTVDNLKNESCNSIGLRNRVVETVDNHVGEENISTGQNIIKQYRTIQHRTKFKMLNKFCIYTMFVGQKIIFVF
jgi:hypothetical protein